MTDLAGKQGADRPVRKRPQRMQVPVPDAQARAKAKAKEKVPKLLPIFILSLIIPILVYVGSVRLAPYLIVLMLAFFPCVFVWIRGGGRQSKYG